MYLSACLSFVIVFSIVRSQVQPPIDQCAQANDIEVFDDGPTSDGTAGIGAEFETTAFFFTNYDCTRDQTDATKRSVIAGRTGKNFKLTADTGDPKGTVFAEYILDGKNIKVGSGDLAAAGAAAAQDLVSWQPWNGPTSTVNIENSLCNPWNIGGPPAGKTPDDLEWSAQITAPMPLEALYSLLKNQDPRHPLTGYENGLGKLTGNLEVVKKDHFKSNTNGIDGETVSDDVFGFCTLVLSYAKGANQILGDRQSPKLFFTFMPRTEFNTIYQQVKSKIPGDLFTLFNSLACYTAEIVDEEKTDNIVLDTEYCSGPPEKPVPNGKFGALSYKNKAKSVNIKNWIQGIGVSSPTPDLLSDFDESIDSSIGGLGNQMEKMYNSQRSVPLFEFRELVGTPMASQFKTYLQPIEEAIIKLHTDFANLPSKLKRDPSCFWPNVTSIATPALASSTITTSTIPASITPPPTPSCVLESGSSTSALDEFCLCDSSVTLPLLDIVNNKGGRCAYKALPTTTPSTKTEVLTSNCAACTWYNGNLASNGCTTVAGCTPTSALPLTTTPPTITSSASADPTTVTVTASSSSTYAPAIVAWVANLSTIDIGNADDGASGMNLAKDMFNKLKAMCGPSGCTADHAEMDNVEAIIAEGEEPLKPAMYFESAAYTNETVFDSMLSVGISSWIAALNSTSLGLCKEVEYEADADETGSGCGKGPITPNRLRRKVRRDDGFVLWEREGLALEERRIEERCLDNCGQDPVKCHYEARMCNAPSHITVVMAGDVSPYDNHMDIEVTLDKTSDGFNCQALVEELTATMIIFAPQLLAADALEGVELQAICGFIDNPQESVINWLESGIGISH